MKKLIAILLAFTMLFSLTACNLGEIFSALSELAEALPTEAPEDDITDGPGEDDPAQSGEGTTASADEYDPSAWVGSNVSISFYFMYDENSDSNELLTLKILGDKAVMYSQKGSEEAKPTTIYEATAEGLVQTSLLYYGDSKIGYQSLPIADEDLRSALPYVMLVAGTFGMRVDSKPLKGLDKTGKETYIGRDCDVYTKDTAMSKHEIYVDRETGIILLNKSAIISNGETTVIYTCHVTEFVYDSVTEADVSIDLGGFNMTYEETAAAQ